MMWGLLVLAGACELGFVAFLQKSSSTQNKFYALLAGSFVACSIFLLSIVTTKIPIGVAYAVWTGIGASLSVIYGMFFLGESKSYKKIFFILLVIIGVIGLKLTGE